MLGMFPSLNYPVLKDIEQTNVRNSEDLPLYTLTSEVVFNIINDKSR